MPLTKLRETVLIISYFNVSKNKSQSVVRFSGKKLVHDWNSIRAPGKPAEVEAM